MSPGSLGVTYKTKDWHISFCCNIFIILILYSSKVCCDDFEPKFWCLLSFYGMTQKNMPGSVELKTNRNFDDGIETHFKSAGSGKPR